jgi:hypothetical protein
VAARSCGLSGLGRFLELGVSFPILLEKIAESVAESINKALEKKINDLIKPLEKKINDQDKTIVEQKDMMQKQASTTTSLLRLLFESGCKILWAIRARPFSRVWSFLCVYKRFYCSF